MSRLRAAAVIAVVLSAVSALAPSASAAGARIRPGRGPASFRVGAAVGDFTPPPSGHLRHDPSDCADTPELRAKYSGVRAFAFEEPYQDVQHSGHYDAVDPYLDCNGNGRWEGNLLGGGADTPRFFTRVADRVGARALVVSHGRRTIAVEVVDQEGLFNIYQDRIRELVARAGVRLDGIFISATHDESAPDTLGLSGVNPFTSGVNSYFADFLVRRSARAIVRAYRAMRPGTIRYAEAIEPSSFRQCWSSYPYVDDQLMPVLQAVDRRGRAIVTLADVSQHAETLGFNGDASDPQRSFLSADWPAFMRRALERRYGGVAIEMAGSVGSVETPEVFASPISRTPQRFISESHPAGCRTVFEATGTPTPTGYFQETRALGRRIAGAVARALTRARRSGSHTIRGARAAVCLPVTNTLFQLGGQLGVFGPRPIFANGCRTQLPSGSSGGNELQTSVASFRIGDGEFISVPGETFPFTFLRGFLGPQDLPFPGEPLPSWPIPHMHAPFRFVDGLADDMLGYIFPAGNGVGVPGERGNGLDPSDRDRFGCGHSDDSEATSSQASNVLGQALVRVLDRMNGAPERIVVGRYVLPGGALSRDPLGEPEIKCTVDQTFHPAGPAQAAWVQGRGIVQPTKWMSLSGRPQRKPDRNTRGYFTRSGARVWIDVFPDVPAS
jgi:hypothetical protein